MKEMELDQAMDISSTGTMDQRLFEDKLSNESNEEFLFKKFLEAHDKALFQKLHEAQDYLDENASAFRAYCEANELSEKIYASEYVQMAENLKQFLSEHQFIGMGLYEGTWMKKRKRNED